MRCEESSENLVAMLHHELPAAAEREIQSHLTTCTACREELEASRNVLRAFRRNVPVEPSASSRQALYQGLRAAMIRLSNPMRPRLPERSDANAAPAPQLGYEPMKALPGPSASSPKLPTPGDEPRMAILSPSASAVSHRLNTLQPKPASHRWAVAVLAVLIAALAVAVYHLISSM